MPQKIIDIDVTKPISSTVAELQLTPQALIILLSDFDSKLNAPVQSICSRAIVTVALDAGALILDDASCRGGARFIAEAALDRDQLPALLGIVPHSRPETEIDRDHELIVRLPNEWTDLAKYTLQIADELIRDGAGPKPAIAVLFGGSEAETKAAVRCARRGWPVLVIGGTGGTADQVLNALDAKVDSAGPTNRPDPNIQEIIETANIYRSSVNARPDEVRRILLGRIEGQRDAAEGVLKQAWLRFDELDRTAMEKQSKFRLVELGLIALAVLATLLAILSAPTTIPVPAKNWVHRHGLPMGTLHCLVLLTPIAISVIAAYNSHFREGTKWILLRGAAEAMKGQIFRFRAQAATYSDEQCLQTSRELELAAKIKDITTTLEQSEVNKTNLLLLSGAGAGDRTKFLSPQEYVEMRLGDQITHYARKIERLARQLRFLQLLVYLAGAAGTFLAALRLDVWVALATASVTALTTKLQADQVENSLMQYNQALTGLRNIEAWWNALSKWEKGRRQNIDVLVDQTEKTLESESARWAQQMRSGLDKLSEKEPHRQ